MCDPRRCKPPGLGANVLPSRHGGSTSCGSEMFERKGGGDGPAKNGIGCSRLSVFGVGEGLGYGLGVASCSCRRCDSSRASFNRAVASSNVLVSREMTERTFSQYDSSSASSLKRRARRCEQAYRRAEIAPCNAWWRAESERGCREVWREVKREEDDIEGERKDVRSVGTDRAEERPSASAP